MSKRNLIKRLIAGEPVERCGFWLGNPDPKTWPILIVAVIAMVARTGFAIEIANIEPTPLFPRRPKASRFGNWRDCIWTIPAQPVAASARITVGTQAPETQDLGAVAAGKVSRRHQ